MDKEKIVRDLLSTFDTRSELHENYKQKMKEILIYTIIVFLAEYQTEEDQLEKWINNFVEERFKPDA